MEDRKVLPFLSALLFLRIAKMLLTRTLLLDFVYFAYRELLLSGILAWPLRHIPLVDENVINWPLVPKLWQLWE
jgi:hypothetical protein